MKRIKGLRYKKVPVTSKVIGKYKIRLFIKLKPRVVIDRENVVWEDLADIEFKTREDAINLFNSLTNRKKILNFINNSKSWQVIGVQFITKSFLLLNRFFPIEEQRGVVFRIFGTPKEAKKIAKNEFEKLAKSGNVNEFVPKGSKFVSMDKSRLLGGGGYIQVD
ncbi:MAG: hypothetical protein AABY22_34310 [Nanoarchaeota archaeon]